MTAISRGFHVHQVKLPNKDRLNRNSIYHILDSPLVILDLVNDISQ